MKTLNYILLLLTTAIVCNSQPVPAPDENIPYLMTFGKKAATSWGDDDFVQVFFFQIPKNYAMPFFIRVYDPDCGGVVDELGGVFDTKTVFSVYGGKGAYSHKDAQSVNPEGNYKSGNMLATKTFDADPKYDQQWYTFGPFNPTDGEYIDMFQSNIFKIIIEGIEGDDGNLYRFYLSTQMNANKPIEGGNAFAFEYTFRMYDDPNQVSHIYPYIDNRTISVKISNFDWDSDGFLRIITVARNGKMLEASAENNWVTTDFKVFNEELNTSFDIQFIKKKVPPVKNNNVVIFVTNQYGENLPFYTIPIGGVPKYKYKIGVTKEP